MQYSLDIYRGLEPDCNTGGNLLPLILISSRFIIIISRYFSYYRSIELWFEESVGIFSRADPSLLEEVEVYNSCSDSLEMLSLYFIS